MQINQAAQEVLAELERCDGHLMHDVVGVEVRLYDGDPAAGSPRASQRVEKATFDYLLRSGLITKVDGREVRQYKINDGGRAALRAATHR